MSMSSQIVINESDGEFSGQLIKCERHTYKLSIYININPKTLDDLNTQFIKGPSQFCVSFK